ncbi:MAG: hypothetical protein NZ455_03435 [Bacteroidia bacterium]|nr:hypothetical protein [Bacteroidia bacterium]MDW8347861.1 hypothetical protein [Bacteroidia bacterium]
MGVSLAALGSGYSALRVRFGATLTLRTALRHAAYPSRKLYFDILLCFYTYCCFTLFNIDYQLLTRLKFFTLFERRSFYLILH